MDKADSVKEGEVQSNSLMPTSADEKLFSKRNASPNKLLRYSIVLTILGFLVVLMALLGSHVPWNMLTFSEILGESVDLYSMDSTAAEPLEPWDLKMTIIPTRFPEQVAYSPDGTILAAVGRNIEFFNVSSGDLIRTIWGHDKYRAFCVAFSPDGTIIASGGWDNYRHDQGVIQLWNVTSGAEIKTINQDAKVISIDFSPDGTKLAFSTGRKYGFNVWDVSGDQIFHKVGDVRSVDFSPDGLLVATGGAVSTSQDGYGRVQVWHVPSGNLKIDIDGWDRFLMVGCVAFSPDGTIVAAGTSSYIQLWDVTSGIIDTRMPIVLPPHLLADRINLGAYPLAFSPDGTILASAAAHKFEMNLWDVSGIGTKPIDLIQEKGNEQHEKNFVPPAFSPDGLLLAIASHDNIKLYDISVMYRYQEISDAFSGSAVTSFSLSLVTTLLVNALFLVQ